MAALLDIHDVSLSFGGLKAVDDFALQLSTGDLHGLIGPNGAGKTTVFNLLTGVYQPQRGSIRLDGRELRGLKSHQITKAGIARTFQNIRLFGELSVLDNVRVGKHLRSTHTMAAAVGRTPHHMREESDIEDRSMELLSVFNLDKWAGEQARNLPYGDQRRLEIARALATHPKVLLLDEPAAGMHTGEKKALTALIRDIRARFGVTILLIEHDMGLVMEVCERITVLDHGQTIAVGTPAEIQKNEKVIRAYLGEPTPA
jgi:branched-chain amino acid transport system ATP-binding protein